MDGGFDVWSRFEDPGVNRRFARRRADTTELVQLVVEVNEPILIAAFGTAKHLYCDTLILGQAHADVTPYVTHFVFEYLSAAATFFFGEFDGGPVSRAWSFCFLHGMSTCLESGRRDDLRLAFTLASRRKHQLSHDATIRMEAKLAGFSFLAEIVK